MKHSVHYFGLLATLALSLACATPKSDAVTPAGSTTQGTPSTAEKKPVVTITVFGSDTKKGIVDGNGTAAKFDYPTYMSFDRYYNLYVCLNLIQIINFHPKLIICIRLRQCVQK